MSLGSRAKVILDVGSTLIVTAAGVALLWTLYKGPRAVAPASPQPQIESVTELQIPATVATNRVGTSTTALIEFSDYQCPYCGRHARDTYPKIRSEWIDTGKLTYVSLAFPLEKIHPDAKSASEAAECAAQQGHFWPMHERLFGAPPDGLNAAHFAESAEAIGLDVARFRRCLMGETTAAVAAQIAEGLRLKVNSTPTFFLGKIKNDGSIELVRRIHGAATFDTFAEALKQVG